MRALLPLFVVLLLLLLFRRAEAAMIPPRPKKTGHPHLDQWDELIYRLSLKHGVEPALAKAVMWKESSGNAVAVKREGPEKISVGLFQPLSTPSTQDLFEIVRPGSTLGDLYNPDINADIGIRILARLLRRYGDNPARIYAAYNAGSALVFVDDGADGDVVHADTGDVQYHHTYQSIPIKKHPRYKPGAFINQDEVNIFLSYYNVVKP